MKYKKALIFVIIFEAVHLSLMMFFYTGTPQFFPEDFLLIVLIYYIVFILGTIFGAVLLGYLLTPVYLFAHKKFIGINKTYGIQDNPKPQKFAIFQSLFPVLLSLNLSLMLISNEIILRFVYGEKIDLSSLNIRTFNVFMIFFVFLNTITNVIAFGIFSPAWFLLDGGIIYSNKESENKKGRPGEVRTVGGWYLYLLRGYAGIGALLSYILLYILFMTVGASLIALILVLIYYSLMPLFLVAMSVIALVILENLREHRVKYVRKWAEKLGITDKVEIIIKKT